MSPIDVVRWTEEIRGLKARYFRLMDTKSWDGYASLFLDDTVFDVTRAFKDPGGTEASGLEAEVAEPVVGRDAIVAYASGGLNHRVRSFHAGLMPEIEILSENSARGIWAMEDQLWFQDGPIAIMHGWGHYHETYTRRDECWYIQTLKLTRIRLELVPRTLASKEA